MEHPWAPGRDVNSPAACKARRSRPGHKGQSHLLLHKAVSAGCAACPIARQLGLRCLCSRQMTRLPAVRPTWQPHASRHVGQPG